MDLHVQERESSFIDAIVSKRRVN